MDERAALAQDSSIRFESGVSLIGLKQFQNGGCLSYLLWDANSRDAVFIDPHVELMGEYRSFVAENRLVPRVALDTHTHADHHSATHLLRAEYGVDIGMSDQTLSQRPTLRLADRQRLEVGGLTIQVFRTPGHTPDSVSYYCASEDTQMVFSGDTLLVGSTGRTDYPGANPAEQWDSLQHVLGEFDANTIVFPGHDYFGYLFSTIGVEKTKNQHWRVSSLNAYVEMKMKEHVPHLSEDSRRRMEFNLAALPPLESDGVHRGTVINCGVPSAKSEGVATIGVQKYLAKIEENSSDVLFVDVREPDEFSQGHIVRHQNIPLSNLGFSLPRLMQAKRIYVLCLSGRRSEMAAKTLAYLGHSDVVSVAGGYKSWTQAGYPIQK